MFTNYLLYLFTTYHNIPKIKEQVFDNEELMEAYEWDIELTSTHQLGIDARSIAGAQTYTAIEAFLTGNHEKLNVEQFIQEMGRRNDGNYERHEKLAHAFIKGFLNQNK